MFKVGALRRAGARRKPPTKVAARGGDRRQAVSGRRRRFCDCITATAVCPPMTKRLYESREFSARRSSFAGNAGSHHRAGIAFCLMQAVTCVPLSRLYGLWAGWSGAHTRNRANGKRDSFCRYSLRCAWVFLWLQVNFCATSRRIGVRSLTRASDFLSDVSGLRA